MKQLLRSLKSSVISPIIKQDLAQFLERLEAKLSELSHRVESGLRRLESGLDELCKKQDTVLLRLRSDLDLLIERVSALTTKLLELERRVEALEAYLRNQELLSSRSRMG